MSGSLAPLRSKCDRMALLSYVCPESTTTTGSRNTVRVMGHMSTSGSASRSASGALGGSPRALAERRVCTPALTFPDTSDVLRRFEGAIERTSGVAPGCALGTLRTFLRSAETSNNNRGPRRPSEPLGAFLGAPPTWHGWIRVGNERIGLGLIRKEVFPLRYAPLSIPHDPAGAPIPCESRVPTSIYPEFN